MEIAVQVHSGEVDVGVAIGKMRQGLHVPFGMQRGDGAKPIRLVLRNSNRMVGSGDREVSSEGVG